MSEKIQGFNLSSFTNICQQVEEKERAMGKLPDKIDKNFLVLSMHGANTYKDYTVPAGVRLIMFCYSGRALEICPTFDDFIWENIMLNRDASFNYCTFISNLAQYPSFRDHFCIYNSGDTLNDLVFHKDPYFRDGLFQLPVQAAVMDSEKGNVVYVSSPNIMAESIGTSRDIHRQVVNVKKTAEWIKAKKGDADQRIKAIFHTPHWTTKQLGQAFPEGLILSELVKHIQRSIRPSFTLLLLTCRTGKYQAVPNSPTVLEELTRLVKPL